MGERNPWGVQVVDFRLYYRGLLKSNGGASHKQDIRRCFHRQLEELWQHEPLRGQPSLLEDAPGPGNESVLQPVGGYTFAPLVTSRLMLYANLHITMLRPEEPGGIIGAGGDIDNRLKTLLDALRCPTNPEETGSPVPEAGAPSPFFCLLEDDRLVRKVSVETDRLLDAADPREVVLVIRVEVRGTKVTFANVGLIA